MPRIFDSIELPLLPALKDNLIAATQADFYIGYFNLMEWCLRDALIEQFSGSEGNCFHLLAGMQILPRDKFHAARSFRSGDKSIDQGEAVWLKKRIVKGFREQLIVGVPTNQDEGLMRLCVQLKAKKLVVKLFLQHTLHVVVAGLREGQLLYFPTDLSSPEVKNEVINEQRRLFYIGCSRAMRSLRACGSWSKPSLFLNSLHHLSVAKVEIR